MILHTQIDSSLKPGFHFDFFCLLLHVLVFRTNKSQNEQPKAFACFSFEIELILSQKQEQAEESSRKQRMAKGNTPQNPKRAAKNNKDHFYSHFQSFASTLNLWNVVGIKGNEKPERATMGNEINRKQQKASTSNKKQKWTSELKKPK